MYICIRICVFTGVSMFCGQLKLSDKADEIKSTIWLPPLCPAPICFPSPFVFVLLHSYLRFPLPTPFLFIFFPLSMGFLQLLSLSPSISPRSISFSLWLRSCLAYSLARSDHWSLCEEPEEIGIRWDRFLPEPDIDLKKKKTKTCWPALTKTQAISV